MPSKDHTPIRCYFHKTRDADLLDKLTSLPYTMRSSFIKEAMRSYINKTAEIIRGEVPEGSNKAERVIPKFEVSSGKPASESRSPD